MAPRRVIIDSDDDVDDFLPLQRRPPRPPKTSSATSADATRPGKPLSQDVERTPGAGVVAGGGEETKGTTVRRRKLGRVNNDLSYLRPWAVNNARVPVSNPRRNKTSDIGLLPDAALEQRRAQLRVELRTRKARRVSELLTDDAGEISAEEATVLENVTPNGEEDGGDGDSYGDDDQYGDEDNESDDSEFHNSEESDLSLDSLDDFFSWSPTKQPATAKRSAIEAPKKDGSERKKNSRHLENQNKGLEPCLEEESSIFFSAEETLPDSLNKPMGNLSLENRNVNPGLRNSPRSITPPKTLTKLQPAGLVSPTKKLPRIPQTPHRPSTDAFWNQFVVDDWNMEHSPRKLLFSPGDAKATKKQGSGAADKGGATPAPSSPVKRGATAASAKEAKKQFQRAKHDLALKFLAELDSTITDGELGRLAAATGGVGIEWTNRLNTTAGRANWRRETLRPKKTVAAAVATVGSDASAAAAAPAPPLRVLHYASIELAEKVIDDEHRLLNVIAHEFCHLANFMVSGVTGNPHGKEFKAWAAQCSRHFGHRGIQVTTKHAYEIDFKYVWTCEACATEFKRHSKSIDPGRHRCGVCKGMLKQTKPVPRGQGRSGNNNAAAGGVAAGTPAPSEYQKFMKEHMASVRRENPGSPQKIIMKLVADKWTKAKELKKLANSLQPEAGPEEPPVPKKDGNASMIHLGKAFVDLTLN